MTALPYVVPFAVVIALLGLHPVLPLSPVAEQVVWILVMIAALALVSRPVLDFRVRNWFGSLALGVLVFVIWIGPDRIFPGYHGLSQSRCVRQLSSTAVLPRRETADLLGVSPEDVAA